MRIFPFLIVTYKIPIRIGRGTLRVGIGFLVRLGPRWWKIVIGVVVVYLAIMIGLPLLIAVVEKVF